MHGSYVVKLGIITRVVLLKMLVVFKKQYGLYMVYYSI